MQGSLRMRNAVLSHDHLRERDPRVPGTVPGTVTSAVCAARALP